MRILFTTDTISRGGKERQLFILTRALLNKGHQIGIITKVKHEGNYIDEYKIDNELIVEFKGGGKYQEFKKFRLSVQHFGPELVVSWDLQTSFFSLLLYRKLKFVFINASVQHGIRLFRFSQILRSLICHFSPYVIANSYAGLKANNLKPGEKAFVLYNGIESKFRNPFTEGEIVLKRQQLIPNQNNQPDIIFVSVANLVPYKDYFTVLKALKKLKEHASFHYFIIGEGPLKKKISEIIKAYKLEGQITLTGCVENVKDYLFISDILIHSSRGEGISNAILEAMVAGLPVIATNVGGIPETVFNRSSTLFPYKDSEALFNCVQKSHSIFAGFNKDSEDYINHLAKFSVETMVRRFEEIVIKVVGPN